MKKITVLILFALSLAYPAEVSFSSPAAGDTLFVGDSATVSLTAPRFPVGSGKRWSLVLIKAPGTASPSRLTLVDTVTPPADTSREWARSFKVPHPGDTDSRYAFALVYHPSMMEVMSPVFVVAFPDPWPPVLGIGKVIGRKAREPIARPRVYSWGPFSVDPQGRRIR